MLIGLQGFVSFRRKLLPEFSGSRTEMLVDVNATSGLGVTEKYSLEQCHGSFQTHKIEKLKLLQNGWN